MLRSKSLNQILDVLTKFRARHSRGEPVIKAYQGAVDEVRKDYQVAYQTIGDLCRRRLQLSTINNFYNLLEQWVIGNPEPLLDVLLALTIKQDHDKLISYFDERNQKAGIQKTTSVPLERETFTFRLGGDAAKKLKILSIEIGSPSEWLSQVVSEVVNRRYKDWLNDQLGKETEGEEL